METMDLTAEELEELAAYDTVHGQASRLAEYVGEELSGALFGHRNRLDLSTFNALLGMRAAYESTEPGSDLSDFLHTILVRMERQIGWEVLDYLEAAAGFGPKARESWEEFCGHLERFKEQVSKRWEQATSTPPKP